MSRPTLSTGGIDLSTGKNSASARSENVQTGTDSCYIAVLADFTGRGHRGLNDSGTISSRKIIEVDRDNLDEVFGRLRVTFDSPLAESAIEFTEPDDLHPDYLYDRVPVFDRFKSLRRRLGNKDTFAEAAAEVQTWTGHSKALAEPSLQLPDAGSDVSTAKSDSDSLLDQLLAEPVARQTTGDFDVKRLVREIMSPYLIPRPDPRQKELIAAVDEATSQLMRKILHNSDFQKIEASWRSLYLLTKRLETDKKLRVFIIDVSQQELIDDASCQAVSQGEDGNSTGALRKLLIDNRAAVGAEPFAMILADYQFSDVASHADTLSYLAEIGAQSGAAVLTGGHERMAGCLSLVDTPDPDDWRYQSATEFNASWQQCRKSLVSQSLAVIAPRFLLRLPYGKKLSRTERFDFEELPGRDQHSFYLWANGAWLATMLLAQCFSDFGWNFKPGKYQEIDRLPIHVCYDEDGDSIVTPCAEVNTTDRAAARMVQSGLLVIRSVYQKDAVLIPDFTSAHNSGAQLQGPWT